MTDEDSRGSKTAGRKFKANTRLHQKSCSTFYVQSSDLFSFLSSFNPQLSPMFSQSVCFCTLCISSICFPFILPVFSSLLLSSFLQFQYTIICHLICSSCSSLSFLFPLAPLSSSHFCSISSPRPTLLTIHLSSSSDFFLQSVLSCFFPFIPPPFFLQLPSFMFFFLLSDFLFLHLISVSYPSII